MNKKVKAVSNYAVQRDYHPIERVRIWGIIKEYREDFDYKADFSKNLRCKYIDTFGTKKALVRGSDKELSVPALAIRSIDVLYDHRDDTKVPNIQKRSWQFLDRVSQLIVEGHSAAINPEIFDYFDKSAVLIDEAINPDTDKFYLLCPANNNNGHLMGVLSVHELVGAYHAEVTLWMNLQDSIKPELVFASFREGLIERFERWVGLIQFHRPEGREDQADVLFRNLDAQIILKGAKTEYPGSIVFRNIGGVPDVQLNVCIFKTPHSEVEYQLIAKAVS